MRHVLRLNAPVNLQESIKNRTRISGDIATGNLGPPVEMEGHLDKRARKKVKEFYLVLQFKFSIFSLRVGVIRNTDRCFVFFVVVESIARENGRHDVQRLRTKMYQLETTSNSYNGS